MKKPQPLVLHRGQLFALSLGQQAQILFISSLYEVNSNEDSMMADNVCRTQCGHPESKTFSMTSWTVSWPVHAFKWMGHPCGNRNKGMSDFSRSQMHVLD